MELEYEKLILDIVFYFTEILFILSGIACLGMIPYCIFFDKSSKIAK